MQFVGLRRLLPTRLRGILRDPWTRLLQKEQHLRERKFYRRFIGRNDLVFDIGANVGAKTAAFLSLDACVIAVEPNPACVDHIKAKNRYAWKEGKLKIEVAAAASANGEVTLVMFDNDLEITSGSTDFVQYAETVGRTSSRTIKSKAITLDQLIMTYGMPKFVKIDVEGMDADVLRGLTSRPEFLSFEYHTMGTLWENVRNCFREADRLGFGEANLTQMAVPELMLSSWIPLEAALNKIDELRKSGDHWGDVIVR